MLTLVQEFVKNKRGKGSLDGTDELEMIGPAFEDTFIQCGGMMTPDHWKCREVLSQILTEDGICYTFNLLNRDDLLKEGA